MAKRKHTVEFCGVKLVRFGGRARRAVKVHLGRFTLAVLPNGTVACSADSPFDVGRRFYGHPADEAYLNEGLADQLLQLGAITPAAHRQHKAAIAAKKQRRILKNAADEISTAAEQLGIKITKRQQRRIEAATAQA